MSGCSKRFWSWKSDFVMLGGMLAGHKEGGGEIIEQNEKIY